jgi:indolepyruvate ferredoxin oxidoreductase
MCRSPVDPDALDVVRIPLGTADLMLAADLAVGCRRRRAGAQRSDAAVIGNLDLAATAEFKRDAAAVDRCGCIAG